MFLADALSRAYIPDEVHSKEEDEFCVHAHTKVIATPEKYELLVQATKDDPALQMVTHCMASLTEKLATTCLKVSWC